MVQKFHGATLRIIKKIKEKNNNKKATFLGKGWRDWEGKRSHLWIEIGSVVARSKTSHHTAIDSEPYVVDTNQDS